MRPRPSSWLFLVPGLVATFAASACFFDPRDLAATGGTGAAGGAGSGGGGTPSCPIESCPNDECNAAVCVGTECGLKPTPGAGCGANGKLQCNEAGVCAGCEGDASKCDAKACHSVACVDNECVHTPDSSLTCGDAQNPGTCDASGSCGLCGDGILNGAELGVDCGPEACGECNGGTCQNDGECHSGHCADFRCCDTACDGNCEGCRDDLTGAGSGTCAPLLPGTQDDAVNPICGDKGGCGMHGVCACEDGELTPGEAGVDCGGICYDPISPEPKVCMIGSPCVTGDGNDCVSGFCVDGFCCTEHCSGQCASCSQPGLEGLCSEVPPGEPDTCPPDESCDGSGNCSKGNDQPCMGDFECASDNCQGQCVPCGVDEDCGGPQICEAGVCLLGNLPLGDACWVTQQCAGRASCVDGVCCDSACDGTCVACHFAFTYRSSGICAPITAGSDPQNECDGTGPAAYCSGEPADPNGNSPCGAPLPP